MSKTCLWKKWIKGFGDNSLIVKNESIFCNVCKKKVSADKKFLIKQHITTKSHISRLSNHVENDFNGERDFSYDLCKAMIAANIPWNSLNNSTWRSFLEKYIDHQIPDESNLRKTYLDKCHEDSLNNIRVDLSNEYIWVSVDETTDTIGRYIANLIVGKMSAYEPTKPYLLTCQELERADHASIARFVNTSLLKLWPNADNSDKVLLLVTDAAPYMVKAAKCLTIFYPNMKHVTCLAHAVHRVAEKIRQSFQEVNSLISSIKKVFLKAPSRIRLYKDILIDCPLPPNPIITRWGTWIEAALFYAENFNNIKRVLNLLDDSETEAIRTAKAMVDKPSVINSLIFIQQHFHTLPTAIKRLEEQGTRLTESIKIIMDLKRNFENVPGEYGVVAREKFSMVLEKNPSFGMLKKMSDVFQNPDADTISENEVKAEHISKYTFAPITSCDVERSFSAYKHILSDKRCRLSLKSLESIMVTYCNI